MPARAAAGSEPVISCISLTDAAADLERMTGLRLNFDMLRRRIERTRPEDLPAVVERIYLRRWGRDARHLRVDDLPKWAAWLLENN